MSDIERRIRERSYQSPGRARATIARAKLGRKESTRLGALVDDWENEGVLDHVVAGEPPVEATRVEVVESRNGASAESNGRGHALAIPFIRLGFGARIRARLTPAGVALLYAARDRVAVPANLLERQGVWETELWEFMSVFGPSFSVGSDSPTVDGVFEVIDARAP